MAPDLHAFLVVDVLDMLLACKICQPSAHQPFPFLIKSLETLGYLPLPPFTACALAEKGEAQLLLVVPEPVVALSVSIQLQDPFSIFLHYHLLGRPCAVSYTSPSARRLQYVPQDSHLVGCNSPSSQSCVLQILLCVFPFQADSKFSFRSALRHFIPMKIIR